MSATPRRGDYSFSSNNIAVDPAGRKPDLRAFPTHTGDAAAGRRLGRASRKSARAGGRADVEAAALILGTIGQGMTAPDTARVELTEAASLAESAGAPRLQAAALSLAAFCDLVLEGDPEETLARRQTAQVIGPSDGYNEACVATTTGNGLLRAGSPGPARDAFDRAREYLPDISVPARGRPLRADAGFCASEGGDPSTFRVRLSEFVSEHELAGTRLGAPDALLAVAHRAAFTGEEEQSAQLLSTVRGQPFSH